MANIPKYLALLERLQQPPAHYDQPQLAQLTQIMQSHLQLDATQLQRTPLFRELRFPPLEPSSPGSWLFCSYATHLLRTITDHQLTATEDCPLSPHQLQLLVAWIASLITSHLAANLEASTLQNPLFVRLKLQPNTATSGDQGAQYKSALVRAFAGFWRLPALVKCPALNVPLIVYTAALYELLDGKEDAETACYSQLLHELCAQLGARVFSVLMALKGNPTLSGAQHQRLHRDLMLLVQRNGGFEQLVRTLLPATASDPSQLAQRSALVSSICAHGGHTRQFYANIVGQAHDFLLAEQRSTKSQRDSDASGYASVALDTLCRIHRLPADGGGQRERIEHLVFERLHGLVSPGDILTGSVLLDAAEWRDQLQLLRLAFFGESRAVGRLPAALLVGWLPVLLELWAAAGGEELGGGKQLLQRLVVYCLANQPAPALGDCIDGLLCADAVPDDWRRLHRRVEIVAAAPGATASSWVGRIAAADYVRPLRLAELVRDVLRQSGHNPLRYNVFLHLLESLAAQSPDSTSATEPISGAGEPLGDLADMDQMIAARFHRRMAILAALSDLIADKSWHGQFAEQPAQCLECLTKLLRRSVDRRRSLRSGKRPPIEDDSDDEEDDDEDDSTDLVILAIVREFIEHLSAGSGSFQRTPATGFLAVLREYRQLAGGDDSAADICRQIDDILRLLPEADEPRAKSKPAATAESAFEEARKLCGNEAPHLKVYGLDRLRKLLLGGEDRDVLANRHSVLMLAMDGLRHEDSYVFLSCIRLLVALCAGPMEAAVVETMVAEFQQGEETVDYRLKVGEVLVKIASELGPLNVRYKDTLIVCFLAGSRQPLVPELRTSSLSNLATLLPLFRYEVHAFFQDLIDITHQIIVHDQHVDCRRAAAMMLAQLVQGFDELLQFQEMLLPVYRALKYVAQHESDEASLHHAGRGIEHLRTNVVEFFTAEPQMPEIRILGINEPEAEPRSTTTTARSPLNVRYKDTLIVCFLAGSRQPLVPELRTSSLSNLATLLPLFRYEVHAFFQDLIDITHQIIVHDQNVGCRRAAAMMLAQLVQGFDDLQQFQEMLLPVYRALKYVAQHESDEATLHHAGRGMEHLRTNVVEFFTAEPEMPEIRILGINEPEAESRSTTTARGKHILEIL